METTYIYEKRRIEFGRQCLFSDKGPDLLDNYPSNKKLFRDYVLRDPVHRGTLCAPKQAEHYLNTMRAEYTNSSMNHVEGGWPKDVNMLDEEQPKRYRRKIEKDEGFQHTMMSLFKKTEHCILQNNAINIYQQYFSDTEPMPFVERSSARTVNVFQDQSLPTRPVNHMSWSPDGQTKLAVSHCNMNYQSHVHRETTHSYIWEVDNPNIPLLVLKPHSSIACLEYNPRDAHTLVSGMLNGQVALWDDRKGADPVELSLLESSFREPCHNVLWINSKSGTDFFSSSTDGHVKWWDIRNLTEPTETLILDYARDEEQKVSRAYRASCLEYETTIPTRFMVGTEQGVVISCNRKNKTAMEKMQFRFQTHPGPVLALQRNPGFVKNFLTVGDWSVKIWAEDCKESFLLWSGYHKVMLMDGAWSPTRLSVFFTTRSDGILDVWDILQQQAQASLSIKVCDVPLRCIRTHDMGKIVAVGNQNGTTYLVQLSDNLVTSNKNDKAFLTAMLDRENHREKILEARNRELRLKQKTKEAAEGQEGQPPPQEGAEGAPTPEAAFAVEPSELDFVNPAVTQAEMDFYDFLEKEKRVIMPQLEEEEGEESQEPKLEEQEPEEPPPPPPTPPQPEEKKGKKKGKDKGEKKDKKGKKKKGDKSDEEAA